MQHAHGQNNNRGIVLTFRDCDKSTHRHCGQVETRNPWPRPGLHGHPNHLGMSPGQAETISKFKCSKQKRAGSAVFRFDH